MVVCGSVAGTLGEESRRYPSGDPEPSEETLSITKRLVQAGEFLGISVLNHVILANRGVVSLRAWQLL